MEITKGSTPYNVTGAPRQGVKAALPNTQKHREPAKLRRQRNTAQMKEWNKTPVKELSKMGIANLSDAEFKTPVRRMLRYLIEY